MGVCTVSLGVLEPRGGAMQRQGPDNSTLLARISAFRLDSPQASEPFSQRLARENEWPRGYATRVIEEYKRFLYLAMIAEKPVTPSDAVDQAWHLHLCYTRSYWDDLCRDVLGMPLHHGPSQGGSAEHRRYFEQYERTLSLYAEVFDAPAPSDIWPDPSQRFAGGAIYRRMNLNEHWIFRKPRLWLDARGSVLQSRWVWPLLSVSAAWAVCYFNARAFLVLYFVCWGLSLLLAFRVRTAFADVQAGSRDAKSAKKLSIPAIAYLAGGAGRTVTCALASLVASNHLLLDAATGTLSRTRDARQPVSPLERNLFARVRLSPTPVAEVRAGGVTEISKLREALEHAGYLNVAPVRQLFWIAFSVPLGGVLMEALVGTLATSTRGSGFVVTLCVTCFAGYWIAKAVSKRAQGANACGRQVHAYWEQKCADLRTAAAESPPLPSVIPLLVAVFGLASLKSSTWDALEPAPPVADSGCGGGCGGCGGG
jgi:uncharacterized protein (TIGR04222 family)